MKNNNLLFNASSLSLIIYLQCKLYITTEYQHYRNCDLEALETLSLNRVTSHGVSTVV